MYIKGLMSTLVVSVTMVNFAIWLVLVVAAAFASPRNHTHEKRITNGYDTNIWDANYYAYLTLKDSACGGTIVSLTRVITAAHCADKYQPQDITIYVGLNSRSELTQAAQYKADDFFIHANYVPKAGYNYDIAIVYVRGQIQTNSNVGIIPYSTSYPPAGDYVMCMGYGKTQTGQYPNRLQRNWNSIKSYEGNVMVTDSEWTSIQPGDSGGPCVYNNKLASVIAGYTFWYVTPAENYNVNLASEEIANFVRYHV